MNSMGYEEVIGYTLKKEKSRTFYGKILATGRLHIYHKIYRIFFFTE